MKFFFRVDSSASIGMGHLMRCLALGEQLSEKHHSVVFICRDLPGNAISLLRNKHFSIKVLSYKLNGQTDLSFPLYEPWLGVPLSIEIKQSLFYLSQTTAIDWLIVDHYGLDAKWERACRPYVKRMMVIDDLADRLHDCDILLDQNDYSSQEKRYRDKTPANCKKLLGPHFALLRAEFKAARENLRVRDKQIRRLLVSLGGNDPTNGTRKILTAIDQSNCSELDIDVVLGGHSQHKEDIQKLCATRKNYHFHCPSSNMATLMMQADLAIGAGGITTWERCCLGLPSFIVRTADNQDEVIRQGLSAKLFDYLGDINKITTTEIAAKLNDSIHDHEKLHTFSRNGMKVVDGSGVEKVINEMVKLN